MDEQAVATLAATLMAGLLANPRQEMTNERQCIEKCVAMARLIVAASESARI